MTFYDPTLYGRDDEEEFGDSGAYSESLEEDFEEEEEEEEEAGTPEPALGEPVTPAPPPPAPKPAETKPAADSTADSTKSDSTKSDSTKSESKLVIKGDPLAGVDLTGGARPTTMGHGKGNIFIVSRGSRSVLWSIYEPPKNNTPRELTKTAERVVKHLQEDLTGKKPAAE